MADSTEESTREIAVAQRKAAGAAPDPPSAAARRTGVDEVILTGHIYDHAARLHSFELVAEQLMAAPVVSTATVTTSAARSTDS